MTRAPVAPSAAPRIGRIRLAGVVVAALLVLPILLEPAWMARLPAAGFDAFQALAPRRVEALPVTVVEIDEKSLGALGRWPWPRTLLAQLVESINRHQPAAIGIDVFMPEPDPFSPERVLARLREEAPAQYAGLAALPSNDEVLARALRAAPAVLVTAGTAERSPNPLRAAPIVVRNAAATAAASPAPVLLRFGGALTSVDEVNRAASGWGLVSVDASGGTLRRIPLVADVNGTLVPALALEMLRVAMGARTLSVVASGSVVQGIALGDAFVPTEQDGAVRIHYSPRYAKRFVSAIDVLDGRVDPERFRNGLVLVGVTGVGLGEYHRTPLGEPMPGSEIHAQLVENVLDGTLLKRPAFAPLAETALFGLLAALLIWATPAWTPRNAALLALAAVTAPIALAYVAFRSHRVVLDAATPAVASLVLFGVLLVLTLAEATRQRRALEVAMQAQRERSARIAGELEAARRIQTATLPDAGLLRDDPRIDLAAAMVPATEVGGDLYDFFRLDERRLFFLVGDVAGKGLSASIFMAVSKALYKSTTLRGPHAGIGELMAEANAEVSRDNPEMLFVTMFAGILDLDSGALQYCNAGHENPYVVHPADGAVRRIEDGGGPPLCALDAYDYRGACRAMRPGELLCLVSDGVTEASNRGGELFGSVRVQEVLVGQRHGETTALAVVTALRSAIEAFAAGAEPADDITILALRWQGPRAREPVADVATT